MPNRWLGVVVGSDEVRAVDAEVPPDGPLIIQADLSWRLQGGARAPAYTVMHRLVADYCREHRISKVIVKESALSLHGMRKANLETAELRGVVMAACASETETRTVAKASASRANKKQGKRNVDDYVHDTNFWTDEITIGDLRHGSREAAMMIIVTREVH